MVKQAYIKTLEMLWAVILTFLFLFFIIPRVSDVSDAQQPLIVLKTLSQYEPFRNAVIAGNTTYVEELIPIYLSTKYDFAVTISDNPDYFEEGLPQKKINVESIFIASNSTAEGYKTVRLYYWLR